MYRMQFMPVRKILHSLQTKHNIFEQKERIAK